MTNRDEVLKILVNEDYTVTERVFAGLSKSSEDVPVRFTRRLLYKYDSLLSVQQRSRIDQGLPAWDVVRIVDDAVRIKENRWAWTEFLALLIDVVKEKDHE